MKHNQKLLVVTGVSILIFLGFLNLKAKNSTSPIQNVQVVQEFKATLNITDGKTNPSLDVQEYIGKTVLEVLQKELNGNLKTSGTGENTFITSLNGLDADTRKHEFWELIVNGKQAEVGAGSYKIQNNDIIVWKISTY